MEFFFDSPGPMVKGEAPLGSCSEWRLGNLQCIESHLYETVVGNNMLCMHWILCMLLRIIAKLL